MADKTVSTVMQQKRGTLANWKAKNPVLKAGELGYITDKHKIVVGDGTSAFNDLKALQIDLADVVGLVGADGKLVSSLIPSLALGDLFTVASEEEMLALGEVQTDGRKAEQGDLANRTDEKLTYYLVGNEASIKSNWVAFLSPSAPVTKVNGFIGNVTLTSDNIDEGETNLYFTVDRANENFTLHASTELTDSDTLLYSSDDIIFDAGEIS